MCRSQAEGGRRCRCTTPEAAKAKRAKRNAAQKRYLERKKAEVAVEMAEAVEVDDAAPITEPEPVPGADDTTYDADAAHENSVAQLNAIFAESKAAQDAAHAARVEAAVAEVVDKPNPFTGLVMPEPESPVSVDEAYEYHLMREAEEEREYRERMERDAAPKERVAKNPFAALVTPMPAPKPVKVNPFAHLVQ